MRPLHTGSPGQHRSTTPQKNSVLLKRAMCSWASLRLGLLAIAVSAGGVAHAQDNASADTLIAMGAQVLQRIDQNQADGVWESASAVLKTRFSKTGFLDGVGRTRQTFNGVSSRVWYSVSRVRLPGGPPPAPDAGLYTNVNFLTQVGGNKQVAELVTFRLDTDNVWRLAGYSSQLQP